MDPVAFFGWLLHNQSQMFLFQLCSHYFKSMTSLSAAAAAAAASASSDEHS
jgi:hypothetical protein